MLGGISESVSGALSSFRSPVDFGAAEMGDRFAFAESSADDFAMDVRFEEDHDEFRSCCEDEESDCDSNSECACECECEQNQTDGEEDKVHEEGEDFVVDEYSVKMYFKGVSVEGISESSCGFTGIGVVMERSGSDPMIRVQKKLDFYAEDSVADYLALIDGLSEAVKRNVKRVLAVTDSRLLHGQILLEENFDNPLTNAFRERIFQLISTLKTFKLKLVSGVEVQSTLHLARVAIGIVSPQGKGDHLRAAENCSICCEDRLCEMMISLKCSHKFCSHCMKMYVEGKVQTNQVPIRCPHERCKYVLSVAECKAFLPVVLYDSFERANLEANAIYCPYPNCSALVDRRACFSVGSSSSNQSDSNCIECPDCQKLICFGCGVPWHTSMSCEDFQDLPLDERDATDITLHHLARDRRWRRCQQCRRMIELAQGCFHMTCWCGHEFCYSCGAEYRDRQQSCECAFWDEPNPEDLTLPATCAALETEQWPWDSLDLFPMILDAYSDQERSQLALIQRFLNGGFSLSDHHPYQSPPHCTDSFVDAMKDLHQLPWLERFVSVISDNYYDDYTH